MAADAESGPGRLKTTLAMPPSGSAAVEYATQNTEGDIFNAQISAMGADGCAIYLIKGNGSKINVWSGVHPNF